MKRTKLFFFHLILFISIGLNAQTIDKATEKNLEKGKQLYSEGKYAKAIDYSKKAYQKYGNVSTTYPFFILSWLNCLRKGKRNGTKHKKSKFKFKCK